MGLEMPQPKTKCLVVTMPNNSRWAIPVSFIANNRAVSHASKFGGDIGRSLAEDTNPLFESDEGAIKDWAVSKMSWADVKHAAIRIDDALPNSRPGVIREKEIIDLDLAPHQKVDAPVSPNKPQSIPN